MAQPENMSERPSLPDITTSPGDLVKGSNNLPIFQNPPPPPPPPAPSEEK